MSGNNYAHIVRWLIFGTMFVALAMLLAFALDWIAAPLENNSPGNVKSLSRQANNAWEALNSQRESISVLDSRAEDMVLAYGEDQSKWPQGKRDEYLQLRQQYHNAIIAYNSACGQYRAMWSDEWRSVPAPDDLPTTCEMISE